MIFVENLDFFLNWKFDLATLACWCVCICVCVCVREREREERERGSDNLEINLKEKLCETKDEKKSSKTFLPIFIKNHTKQCVTDLVRFVDTSTFFFFLTHSFSKFCLEIFPIDWYKSTLAVPRKILKHYSSLVTAT